MNCTWPGSRVLLARVSCLRKLTNQAQDISGIHAVNSGILKELYWRAKICKSSSLDVPVSTQELGMFRVWFVGSLVPKGPASAGLGPIVVIARSRLPGATLKFGRKQEKDGVEKKKTREERDSVEEEEN